MNFDLIIKLKKIRCIIILHLITILFFSFFEITIAISAATSDNTTTSYINKIDNLSTDQKKEGKIALKLALDTDIGIYDGVNFSTAYSYVVRKMDDSVPHLGDNDSFESNKNKFVRLDQVKLATTLSFGEGALLSTISPVNITLNAGSELFSLRFFDNKKEALKAKVFNRKNLPVNAQKAQSLSVGEMIVFSSTLNMSLGAKVTLPLQYVNLQLSGNVFIQGNFQIEVVKMGDNLVRTRLKLIRERGIGGRVAIGTPTFKVGFVPMLSQFAHTISDPVMNLILDSQVWENDLNQLLDMDVFIKLIEFNISKSFGESLIIDYVFNLNDPEACEAYNEIFKARKITAVFKELVKKRKELTDFYDGYVHGFEKANILANEDINDDENPRVIRIFEGINKFTKNKFKVKTSLLVVNANIDNTSSNNKIEYIDSKGINHDFSFLINSWKIDSNLLFGVSKQNVGYNNFILLNNIKPSSPSSSSPLYTLGTFIYRNDTTLTKVEINNFLKYLKNNLPESIFSQLTNNYNFKEWFLNERSLNNVKHKSKLRFQMLFTPQTFDYLKNYSKDELNDMADLYLKKVKSGWMYHGSIKRVINKLFDIINGDLTNEEKIKIFKKLKNSLTYNLVGMGFIASLLPQNSLNEYLYVILEFHAKDKNPFEIEIGNRKRYVGSDSTNELFKALKEMQSLFYERNTYILPKIDMNEMINNNYNDYLDYPFNNN
ncbi:MAG: hypothetical protein HQK51_07285 [Oligoflexia bacterium]|nr:hypothetical protein [Oligoflexia bacterium]